MTMIDKRIVCLMAAVAIFNISCGDEESVSGPTVSADAAADGVELDSLVSDEDATTVDDAGPAGTDAGPADSGVVTPDGGAVGGDALADGVVVQPDVTDDVDPGTPDTDPGTPDVDPGTPDAEADVEDDAGADAEADAGADAEADAEADAAAVDAGPVPDCVTDQQCTDKLTLGDCLVAKCKESKCAVELAPEGEACDDGDKCTAEDKCSLGQCVSGKAACGCKVDNDCDDKDECTADTCDIQTGDCGNKVIVGGACNDGDACTEGTVCAADGKCGAGQAPNCDDSNPCTDDSCDKAAGCTSLANSEPCNAGNACFEGGTCKDGKCEGGKEIVCDDKNPCTDDKCDVATGKCAFAANSAGCDDENKCTADDVCADSKCSGAAIKCDDSNPCTEDSCNAETGVCTVKPAAGDCDDGNSCTQKDACADAKCVGGDVKTCDDDNPCTDDTCDQEKGCQYADNSAKCADAANCKSGACKDGKCELSDVVGCDDNNVCTTDKCEAGTGCVYTPVADGGKCDDGSKCTEGDACKAGECAADKATDCGDDNPCTTDKCDPKAGCSWGANTDPCEDGDECTKGDKCGSGKCVSGTKLDPKVDCDDKNGCTTDTCAADKGCVHTPAAGACDDGDKCSTGDACNKEGKCAGTGDLCPDGGQCKVAKCDAATGACSWGAKDGSKCTEGDACKNGNCVPAKKVDCDDKNGCTKDACTPATGACTHVATSDPCDDGNVCTSSDACVGGKCTGAAKDCADGDPCTADSCDAKTGVCGHVKDPDCMGCKSVADCDDGKPCTTDSCNGITGKCGYTFNTDACDNNDPCTYGDKCDGKGTCVTGKAAACDDDNPCTTDTCNKADGKCAHEAAADGAACSDNLPCTTGDACAAGVCVAKVDNCDLYFEPFDCPWNNQSKGWTLYGGNGGNAVRWAIDNTPAIAMDGKGCNLNYNDGTDYCQPAGGGCQNPNHRAYAPAIDASKATGTPRIQFWTYHEVDGGTSTGTDQPRLLVYRNNTILHTIYMDKAQSSKWRQVDMPIPNIKGLNNIRIRFDLANSSGGGGNNGKGWFIDDLRVTGNGPPPEICDNGEDDDGDKKVDCADADCAAAAACKEQCDDGKDNDLDDKVDCADPDCAEANVCKCLSIVCDDKKVCTDDKCDPATAKCVFNNNSALCDDGDKCTGADTCGDGACIGAAKDCADGDPCTADSCDEATGACKNTKIDGCGGCKEAADCEDGNSCTDDACDVATGKCVVKNNTAPCDSGDLCTWGDKCDGKGSCVAGKNATCDDGSACTEDKCEAKTGECLYGNLADGSACNDGLACTTGDACLAGKCAAKVVNCPLYSETFDCPFNVNTKGWTLQAMSQGSNPIKWAVDNTPNRTQAGKGCNLNYNDGTDYCTPYGGSSYCRPATQSAWTPVIDASAVQGTPHLKFTTWYDVNTGNNDVPTVTIYAGNSALQTFTLSKSEMKKWRNMAVAVPLIKGHNNIRVRFYLTQAGYSTGKKGQGWFIDDLEISNPGAGGLPTEVCDNGKDDDGDGKADCQDTDCKEQKVCDEVCDDNKDNDFDDKIDCADPDCSADAVCQPPLFEAAMDCGDKGWAFSAAKNKVAWAIDATPAAIKPQTGGCTMNFNNGTNFCGNSNCGSYSNWTAGTATLDKEIDATGLTELRAEYWSYMAGEDPAAYNGNGAYYDVGFLQVSSSNFQGCCSGANVCNGWSSEYCNPSNGSTDSFLTNKTPAAWKKWVKVKVDLKAWAGKKFKLRLRFSSRNSNFNQYQGWFVDDLKIYGGK